MASSTLLPLVSALSPGISVFMNKLIASLIQGVAHRPNSSPYKDQLIQKFTQRALAGTRIQDTQVQNAFEQNIAQKQYQVAINTLRSHEVPLDIDQYFPETGLGGVKNSVLPNVPCI